MGKRLFRNAIVAGFMVLTTLIVSMAAKRQGPHVALAQACNGAMTVNSVDPSAISNAAATTILVDGTGFDTDVVVSLLGYGNLATTYVDATTLTAVVPPGVPGDYNGRRYTVRVTDPSDGDCGERANALIVLIPVPTATPPSTGTPTPTNFVRPLITVQSYGASSTQLSAGQNIDFEMTLQNSGQLTATNVVVTFLEGDLIPRATGGVRALGDIPAGGANRFFQPFTVSSDLSGRIATMKVEVKYYDQFGTSYTDNFSLTFDARPRGSGTAPTATPTPTPGLRPQLVIETYATDVQYLQPGSSFTLTLNVRNLGAADAKGVTMIVGGGSVSDSSQGGTPSSGGVSGGSGEFTNFAPLGSSNVQFLGDLGVGLALTANHQLVVNVSTNPGAYPFKVSFAYTDPAGRRFTDDQVITLLVYRQPQVDVNFYRDPNPILAGQPSVLPLQIINLGKSGFVLGNMEVTTEGGQITNNTILIGLLDAGGFFTMDAVLTADQPGPLELTVKVNYTDDFNQPQVIIRTLTVDVQEAPVFEPGPGEGGMPYEPMPAPPETLLQKVWRFIRGLLGLDSAPPTGAPRDFEQMPPGEEFMPGGGGGGVEPTAPPVMIVPAIPKGP